MFGDVCGDFNGDFMGFHEKPEDLLQFIRTIFMGPHGDFHGDSPTDTICLFRPLTLRRHETRTLAIQMEFFQPTWGFNQPSMKFYWIFKWCSQVFIGISLVLILIQIDISISMNFMVFLWVKVNDTRVYSPTSIDYLGEVVIPGMKAWWYHAV